MTCETQTFRKYQKFCGGKSQYVESGGFCEVGRRTLMTVALVSATSLKPD